MLNTEADSRSAMTFRRMLAAYATETKFECLRVLRSPAFSVPILVLPVAFYLLLGVAMAGARLPQNAEASIYIYVAFVIYSVLAPGLIGVSSLLASDRVQGVLVYKRALPAPMGSFVVAKLLMALALSIVVVLLITILGATLGHVPLSGAQFVATGALEVVGVLPVSAMGLWIATQTSPSGASAIASASLVAMAILAGLFYPMPGILDTLRPIWPTYHLQQLTLALVGESRASGGVLISAVTLIAFTVAFGGLAARRLARSE